MEYLTVAIVFFVVYAIIRFLTAPVELTDRERAEMRDDAERR